MNVHRRTQRALYDLLTGSLRGDERAHTESHLSACPRCARARDRMMEALSVVPPPGKKASDLLPESYWTSLAGTIQREIAAGPRRGPRGIRAAASSLRLLPPARRWALGSAAAALALLALVVMSDLTRPEGPRPPAEHLAHNGITEAEAAPPGLRTWNSYLRRSRILLTGISKAPDISDLSVERNASRELLTETRRLRSMAGDPEAERILNAVEPLMLKLANTSENSAGPDRELIRTGVRDHNLLFRLRMAEIASSHSGAVPVHGR